MKKFYRLLSAMLLVFVALNVQAQLDTVFYYNFNETLADFSSNGNDLTAVGSDANPVYGDTDGVAGKGKYLDLSGNTNNAIANLFVKTPAEIFNQGSGTYTIAGWVKLNVLEGRMNFVNQDTHTGASQYLMKWYAAGASKPWLSGKISNYIAGTDTTINAWFHVISPADSLDWHHFAVTVDPGNNSIEHYWDGELKNTSAALFTESTEPLNFGALPDSSEALNGALDELYLFRGILTAEEIVSVMNSGEQTIPVSVTGVELDQTTATIDVDATLQLTATVSPADASDKSLTWSSSADAIATVNSSGLVTGVAEGTATITVTTNDGDFTATADITVDATTAIKAVTADNFTVYPNPVKENLFIDGGNIHSATLYSITGSAVMYIEDGISEGIDVTSIKSGIYFLKISADKGTAVTKILKE